MAGRHKSSSSLDKPRRISAPVVVVLLLAILVLGAGAGIAALEYPSRTGSADAAAATKCVSRPALTVVAAPQIEAAVKATAANWANSRPIVGGACPTIAVTSATSADEEARLAKPGAALPDLWIADSSVWVTRLHSDATAAGAKLSGQVAYPSIAMSPLVLATTAGHQSALAQTAARGWSTVLGAAPGQLAIIDPATSTDGLLALLTASASGPTTLAATLQSISHNTLANAGLALTDLRTHPATALSFPASEQEVIGANKGVTDGGTPVAVAVYPSGVSLQLDFPVLQFSPAGSDTGRSAAAAAFVTQLSQPYALQQYAATGLRDPSGDPLAVDPTGIGTSPPIVTALASPSMAAITTAMRAWQKAAP